MNMELFGKPDSMSLSEQPRIAFPDPKTAKTKKNRFSKLYARRNFAQNIASIQRKNARPGGKLSAHQGASESGLKTVFRLTFERAFKIKQRPKDDKKMDIYFLFYTILRNMNLFTSKTLDNCYTL